jgi:membrane protease YdiL (CAAX protease family)
MRLLIGIYLVLGIAQLVLSGAIALFGVRKRVITAPGGSHRNDDWTEDVLIAALTSIIGLALLLTAYGLWKKWRLLRSVLIGLSVWSIAVGAFATCVAMAMLVGWSDGSVLGTDDPPSVTLLLALAVIVIAVLHLRVLIRREVKEIFRNNSATVSMNHPAASTES